jgi:hypothetical protein
MSKLATDAMHCDLRIKLRDQRDDPAGGQPAARTQALATVPPEAGGRLRQDSQHGVLEAWRLQHIRTPWCL